jgi:SagB-type dehydrogenase family enzyme
MPQRANLADPAWQAARTYHEATKHAPKRYARSPGHLDWTTQPIAFRRYQGADWVELPLSKDDHSPPYDQIFEPRTIPPREITIEAIGELLECSLAITAWKQNRETRWALRANPSSGNLHPTEGYLVLGPMPGLGTSPGVYHYSPQDHGLERRTEMSDYQWRLLTAAFPKGTFFVGASSIVWREAWKYGERAYRYCQHDLGHALACVRVAAAALGWQVRTLDGIGDARVARLLGLDRPNDFPPKEFESPGWLAAVVADNVRCDDATFPWTLPAEGIDAVAAGRWCGVATQLSPAHVDWDAIDDVSTACVRADGHLLGRRDERPVRLPWKPPQRPLGLLASQVVKQRRSAVAMDGRTSMPRDAFFGMLQRLVPTRDAVPWDAVGWPPCISLALFVHRVRGVMPGLYLLGRTPDHIPPLHDAMNRRFHWQRPEGCPEQLQLYFLAHDDLSDTATEICCRQEIAGKGVFCAAMLADWTLATANRGGWFYRGLLWEAGMIGQMLYLEAEAAGLRGTGIGCYFDDAVHQLLGLHDARFQCMYYFTVGGDVADSRTTTLPAYRRD